MLGISNAVLLSQYNEVVALDINPIKVEMIKQHKSLIEDTEIAFYLKNKSLQLKSTVPVGYTDKIKKLFNCNNIIYFSWVV
jgi:UDP-glucose 6-dehydrogenase